MPGAMLNWASSQAVHFGALRHGTMYWWWYASGVVLGTNRQRPDCKGVGATDICVLCRHVQHTCAGVCTSSTTGLTTAQAAAPWRVEEGHHKEGHQLTGAPKKGGERNKHPLLAPLPAPLPLRDPTPRINCYAHRKNAALERRSTQDLGESGKLRECANARPVTGVENGKCPIVLLLVYPR